VFASKNYRLELKRAKCSPLIEVSIIIIDCKLACFLGCDDHMEILEAIEVSIIIDG
jgi:hypothetical protein